MSLNQQSGQPLYRQIAEHLRSAIYRRELPPGSQLPSERELIEKYGASRNTVRLALGLLANEGLTVSGQGRGHFVRERAPLRYLASLTDSRARRESSEHDAFVTDMAEQGREGRWQIEVATVNPADDIATRLALDEGDSAVVRRRVQFVDDEPVALVDSYFPLSIVEGTAIAGPDDVVQGNNRVLEENGHRQVRFLDEITFRMPSPRELQSLRLRPGTPVACLLRTGYDQDDLPVRVAQTILPGDRYTIVYEVPAEC